MIHVVFGKSVAGSLQFGLKDKSQEIIIFPIDFSIGPITNIHEENGAEAYFTWLKANIDPCWSNVDDGKLMFEHAIRCLQEVKSGDQITIWICENATEQIGLRLCCYLLGDKEVKLNLVNTFLAMQDFHKDKIVAIRHTGECDAMELAYFYQHNSIPVLNEVRIKLAQEGKELIRSKHCARSWRRGEVIHELETKDDAFILDCARKDHLEMDESKFILVARLIGEVIGSSEQYVSDAWIEYRVRSLISLGHLIREGDTAWYQVKMKL